jgi:purine nucleosidase
MRQAMQTKIPVIHDGDHGTDDVTTTLYLLGYPDQFDLLGVTTVQGNVPVATCTQNALRTLSLADAPHIPVFQGRAAPISRPRPFGDDAFGDDGLGGVMLPAPLSRAQTLDAVSWMVETLRASHQNITLIATGPLTNIAALLQTAPDVADKIERIVVMGGALHPLANTYTRCGNITPYAEFNFYMDPEAADFVLGFSGLHITLLPLDATHKMDVTHARQARAMSTLPAPVNQDIVKLLTAAAHLDQPKFACEGAFHHDTVTGVYLLKPHLFDVTPLRLSVVCDDGERMGQCVETHDPTRPQIHFITALRDVDAVFDEMLSGIAAGIQK